MEHLQEELFQKRYHIAAYCALPIVANLIGWRCFSQASVHADPRARLPRTEKLKTIWLFSQIAVKCSVTRASAEGWIFKRPEPLDSSFENLAEFQCQPGFRNLLYLH